MAYTAAVITVSDKAARGERADSSGPILGELLRSKGWDILYTATVPDEAEDIKAQLIKCADEFGANLILTTGGTGFSPRDITPEATMAVVERPCPGIAELMRAESMRITPRGCLSRSAAGIRSRSLIINLPGSEKAARENILAVLDSLPHGLDMLLGSGSADCGEHHHHHEQRHGERPSMDVWLREARALPDADKVGMYLSHTGVVRGSARARVRQGDESAPDVLGMDFDYDEALLESILAETQAMEGIYHVRLWLARGRLKVGDDIMCVLIGGDIRPHVADAMQHLLDRVKNDCVREIEIN